MRQICLNKCQHAKIYGALLHHLKVNPTFSFYFFRSNSHSSSKKDRDKDSRKRSSSSVKLDKLEGPAAKMARAIGTDPNKEARFLEESIKKTNDRKIVKPRLLPQTDK